MCVYIYVQICVYIWVQICVQNFTYVLKIRHVQLIHYNPCYTGLPYSIDCKAESHEISTLCVQISQSSRLISCPNLAFR